jgi:hypothetical protein
MAYDYHESQSDEADYEGEMRSRNRDPAIKIQSENIAAIGRYMAQFSQKVSDYLCFPAEGRVRGSAK